MNLEVDQGSHLGKVSRKLTWPHSQSGPLRIDSTCRLDWKFVAG